MARFPIITENKSITTRNNQWKTSLRMNKQKTSVTLYYFILSKLLTRLTSFSIWLKKKDIGTCALTPGRRQQTNMAATAISILAGRITLDGKKKKTFQNGGMKKRIIYVDF